MSATTLKGFLWPTSKLPADFPFSPARSGKLYVKSLVCYLLGTFIPLGLFFLFLTWGVKYQPDLVESLLDGPNQTMFIACFAALTFMTGFGSQFLYVRSQIHKQGRTMRDVLSLDTKYFPGSTLKLVGFGLLTFLVAAGIEQGLGSVWPFPIKDSTGDLIKSMHGLSFAIMALLAVFAPVFEEIIFRGFLYGSLRTSLHKRLPAPTDPAYGRKMMTYDLLAAFISAAVFGIAHMNLAGLPLYIISGMVFAEAYRRSGSLYVPMIGHFINNGILMLLMMFMA